MTPSRVSILIPVFGEAGIISETVAAMRALDYPVEHLEILFLFEEIDTPTLAAFTAADPPRHMRPIVVPCGLPQTKPRALAYGMTFLTGDLVSVYDAEDVPDPRQIWRAVRHFKHYPETGCLQFALNIDNRGETWITRQFALEYTALFDAILPALETWHLPIPLGGTSNFIPRAVLESVGGWDVHNVTEDADLGLRLARFGWRVRIDPSTTWEEAPGCWRPWLRQRTRWIKGWMQTYLVHMRDPKRTWRDLGVPGFLGFQVVMAAQVLAPLVHPWALGLTLASLAKFTVAAEPLDAIEKTLLAGAVLNLLLGYGSGMAVGLSSARRRGFHALLPSIIAMPIYWLMISIAAHRALAQLIVRPFYWEKTPHLGRSRT